MTRARIANEVMEVVEHMVALSEKAADSKGSPVLAEIDAITDDLSENARQNVEQFLQEEEKWENGLNRKRLSEEAGWQPSAIYQILRRGTKRKIGVDTLARFQRATKIPAYFFLMPPDLFKREFLNDYKLRRKQA